MKIHAGRVFKTLGGWTHRDNSQGLGARNCASDLESQGLNKAVARQAI